MIYATYTQTLWGGFLSPGGVSEVEEILRGIDLSDKPVLDIGCGNGSLSQGRNTGLGSLGADKSEG